MTTIARINTSINDHGTAAKTAALFVLACISIFSAAATIHNGNLVKSSYNSLLQSIPAEQATVTVTPASEAQAGQQTSVLVLGDSASTPARLQPAVSMATNAQYGTISLQPNTSGVQYVQNAASLQ
ncbi:MAG TPA: hypothetical protein VLG47_06605 [Candidatus Saccharimonadales bacterium]|nr:hypothetical protein [Candidatus Saccharimonadales bacterium]